MSANLRLPTAKLILPPAGTASEHARETLQSILWRTTCLI